MSASTLGAYPTVPTPNFSGSNVNRVGSNAHNARKDLMLAEFFAELLVLHLGVDMWLLQELTDS